jgi:hypothetical protein
MQGVSDTPNLFPGLTRWFESKSGRIIVNLLIIGLILLALILPPISLVERLQTGGYATIPTVGGSVVDPDGTQVIVPQEGLQDANGTASKAVRLQLSSTPREPFIAGEAGRDLVAAAEQLPANRLIPRSPLYQVTSRGDAPGLAVLRVPIPNDSEPYDTLDLYAYDGEPATWHHLPSQIIQADDVMEARLDYLPAAFMVMQTAMQPPRAAAQVSATSPLPEEGKGALVEVNPVGLLLGDGGDIKGGLQGLPADATSAFAVVPTLRNWEDSGAVRTDLIANMLVTEEQRQRHIDAIEQLVVGNLYAGINLDYRGIDANLSQDYLNFVTQLAERLHAQGKTLSVTVEEPRQVAVDTWETGPYNWQKLGAVVDTLRVPAPGDPKAYTSDGQIHNLLRWAVGQVDRSKIQLLLPGTSIEQSGNYYLPKSYGEALAPLIGQIQASTEVTPGATIDLKLIADRATSELVFDENVGAYTYRYRDDQGYERTVWLENAESLSHKLQLVNQYHLQGATIQSLPTADPEIWNALTTFQQGQPAANRSQFGVSWQVEGPDGQVIKLGDDALLSTSTYTWQVPDNPGAAFKVQAAIVEDGRPVSEADAVAMVVATYTPVPTETPVPTATPTPRPTATPRPAAPAAPAQPANTSPAPAPVGPSRGSGAGFGYGVQAQVYGGADLGFVSNATQGMGFNWVKFQAPWKDFEGSKGDYGWGGMDSIVNTLSGSGLKILASIVKAPNWARNPAYGYADEGPPQNLQDYADFVGAYAARYCGKVQAIEVWNEQNLHYEWGNEPLDPGRYVAMLKLAYGAIKAACPSMTVVSGALTPAGSVPGKAIDDVEYLQAMYRAGMKGYADAIGSHPSGYNCPANGDWRSVQDPTASFRGPFDNRHHSWCFRGTMESYRNVMIANGDGGKKIWPTEFGWAIGPAVNNSYGYANDNTAEEQARWLVEAYQIARGWGWVGPMFLWNLNFGITNPGTELAQFGVWGRPAYDALKAMPK